MKEDDLIELYPSKKLMNYYRKGVPIEEVKRKLRKDFKKDESAYKLAVHIAIAFYKKWDDEGGIR